jgi:GNAT superfamily N-acetyltransferase
MKDVAITPAAEADIPELIDLLGVLFAIEQDFSPNPDKQRRGLAALLASPAGHIAIARDRTGRAIGMATAQLVISTAEGAPSAWIEDVVVREGWRGHGLGRALLDAVVAWARTRGAVRAQLLADLDNAPALAFYDRLAWRPTRLGARRLMLGNS